MALLSRKVDYALLVLSYLHHRDAGGCAREIAERFGLKKAFTAKVLKLLCCQGLVRGQRGLHGGYVLARRAEEVRLCDLLDLMGEPFRLADCGGPVDEGGCGLSAVCPVREAVAAVDRRIREVLRAVTLADLFREPAAAGRFGLAVLPTRCAEGAVPC
jgi:Rrf2 family cysteine metabolism transcriptional repressor